MIIDTPELLQFAAFVGERAGFAPPPDRPPRSPTEAEWQQWWDGLPTHIQAGLPIDWPPFASVGHRPTLQALCQAYWEAFLRDWRREKPFVVRRRMMQTQALRIQDIVSSRSHELGRPARDLTLRLEFTRWPEHYQRAVSGSHLVLGQAFLESSRLNELRALVEARIEALA